jgi:hypothetical protein
MNARGFFFGVLSVLLLAAPASAVVTVTVTVTDSTGQPVPSAEVDLGLGGPPVTTNAQGQATADVPDDQANRRITMAVTFVDGQSQSRRTVRRSVTLSPNVQFQLPSFSMSPARRFGCRAAGGATQFSVGLGYAMRDHAPLVSQTFEFGRLLNGQPLTTFAMSGEISEADRDAINAADEKYQRLVSIPDLSAQVSMPELFGRRPCDIPGLIFIPTIGVGVDWADVTFESENVNPAFTQSFTGTGRAFHMEVGGTFIPPDSNWIVGLAFEHTRTMDTDVERNRPVSDFFAAGARTLRDEAEYNARTNGLRLTLGYGYRDWFFPYAGFSVTWFTSHLHLDSDVDITATVTSPANSQVVHTQVFDNTFEETYARLVAGGAFPIGGPIVLSGEGRFGKGGADLLVKVGLFVTR